MEVVKTEVEEIADGGESGGEGGARHCASYGSGPAVTRGGREIVQSGGPRTGGMHLGCKRTTRSFDKMVARYASATPCGKKRVSMESSLTSSGDRVK